MTKHTFTRDDLIKLAKLAAIPLTPKEIQQLTSELNRVFEYFQVIDEASISSLTATTTVNRASNITREDKISPSLSMATATRAARHVHKGYFVVNAVL